MNGTRSIRSSNPKRKESMTLREIVREVEAYKPITREGLYLHLRALKIKPISRVRQIPQQYPADTGLRVLIRLGFKPKRNGAAKRTNRNGRQLVRS